MTIGKTNKRTAADGLSFAKEPPLHSLTHTYPLLEQSP